MRATTRIKSGFAIGFLVGCLAGAPVRASPDSERVRALAARGDAAAFAELRAIAESGGPADREALESAIRIGRAEGVALARQHLEAPKPSAKLAVYRGLSWHASEAALTVLRDECARVVPWRRNRRLAENSWVAVFRNLHGPRSEAVAAEALRDPRTLDADQALHLLVFRGVDRARALETYRPYLEHPAPELRRAALRVNSAHWDHEVLPVLLALENGSDPAVRKTARSLVRRYLRWGDARPRRGETELSASFIARRPRSVDPAGLEAWSARQVAWSEEQYRLIHGEDPPPPPPPPPERPSAEFRPAAPLELDSDGSPAYRPGPR